MGIASAVETAPDMERFFLSAPNDLYPWGSLDQARSGWIRSAVHLHLSPLPWRATLLVPSNRSATRWADETLLDCSFAVSADGLVWWGGSIS